MQTAGSEATAAAAPRQGRAPLSRQYVKFCDLADFDDPVLRAKIRDIVPGHEPHAELRKKYWEYATLALFLEDVGRLNEETRVLSVGAGHEEVLYWLANYVGQVVATDIYGEGDFAGGEADASMLTDPEAFAPYPYREDRLQVHTMDARTLEFPDESFDVVFSLSSIEHFGSAPDIERSAREIGRVLRPGGHAFVVTECFLERHPMNSRLLQTAIRVATLGRRCTKATPRRRTIDVFTPKELQKHIVGPSGLKLVQPLDRSISEETWENVTRWTREGGLEPSTGDAHPYIILRPEGAAFFLKAKGPAFTSVALALRKPSARSPRETFDRR